MRTFSRGELSDVSERETSSTAPSQTPPQAVRKWKKRPDFSVEDASAALPQNCQTTRGIVEFPQFPVNVTLVIPVANLGNRPRASNSCVSSQHKARCSQSPLSAFPKSRRHRR